jgi:hypothetical protein
MTASLMPSSHTSGSILKLKKRLKPEKSRKGRRDKKKRKIL